MTSFEVDPDRYSNKRPPSTPRHYNLYTYGTKRQPETPRSGASAEKKIAAAQQSAMDPARTVVHPLNNNHYGFAIAEDGVLHSRLVAPPRKCYAPMVQEVTPEQAIAQGLQSPLQVPTLWETFKEACGIERDSDMVCLEWSDIQQLARNHPKFTPLDIARIEVSWKKLRQADVNGELSSNADLPDATRHQSDKKQVTLRVPGEGGMRTPPETPTDFRTGASGASFSPSAVDPAASGPRTPRAGGGGQPAPVETPRSVKRPDRQQPQMSTLNFSPLSLSGVGSPSIPSARAGAAYGSMTAYDDGSLSHRSGSYQQGPFIASPVPVRKPIFREKLSWKKASKIDNSMPQSARASLSRSQSSA